MSVTIDRAQSVSGGDHISCASLTSVLYKYVLNTLKVEKYISRHPVINTRLARKLAALCSLCRLCWLEGAKANRLLQRDIQHFGYKIITVYMWLSGSALSWRNCDFLAYWSQNVTNVRLLLRRVEGVSHRLY